MYRRTAAAMAAMGFALTCLVGAMNSQSVEHTLSRALVAMLVFFLIGLGVGWAAELLLREHFENLTRPGEDRSDTGNQRGENGWEKHPPTESPREESNPANREPQ